jgi:hypothetical protein
MNRQEFTFRTLTNYAPIQPMLQNYSLFRRVGPDRYSLWQEWIGFMGKLLDLDRL